MATWESLTLGDIFPGMKESVENIKNQTGDLINKANAVAAQLNEKLNALQEIATTATSLAVSLTESGFYVLMLSPDSGGLVQRISSAQNPPPAEAYSAGIVIGISAPDIVTASAKFQKLMDILTKPVQVPK